MELSPAQRKVLFALVVVALAALAVYLFVGRGSGAQAPAASGGHSSRPAAPAGSAPPPSAPPPSPASAAVQAPGIYQLVPFTAQGLAAAETMAVRFGIAYGTYSYTESASAYLATLTPYVSSDLAGQIAAAYAAPGVASQRASGKQVATATAQVTALRAFGSSSLTLIVEVDQQVTATKGGGPSDTGYAVTLTGGGGTWQVTDIELESAGQF